MTRRIEEAVLALRGTYVKSEELMRKQRNLLKILKSAAESGQPSESSADSETVKLESATGIESKTPVPPLGNT